MEDSFVQIKHLDCQGCNNHCPLTISFDHYEIKEVHGNCCHRGLISAETQIAALNACGTFHSFTGIKNMYCKSCANHCPVLVHIKNGKIKDIETSGCRRALTSIQKQLNNLQQTPNR